MKTYGNWMISPDGREWRHTYNPLMIVAIVPVSKYDRDTDVRADNYHMIAQKSRRKYRIMHTHPTRTGKVIVQPAEYAGDMIRARKLAVSHLKNWNDPTRWFKHH